MNKRYRTLDYKKAYHETVIRDIIDVVSDFKDTDEIQMVINRDSGRSRFTSIANTSANMTLVFPLACTRSISIETASMLAKAMERKAVSMLQIVFSAYSLTNVKTGEEYIRQFHSNLKLGDMTVDDFIDYVDNHVEESAYLVPGEIWKAVKEDLRNIDFKLRESCSHISINDYIVLGEANQKGAKDSNENPSRGKSTISRRYNNGYSRGTSTTENKNNRYYNAKDLIDFRNNKNKYRTDMEKNEIDVLNNQLQTSDVKKANELVPSMMLVRIVNNKTNITSVFYIGVKVKIVPLDSQDIIDHIILKYKDNNLLIKLIQATTRETSFVKDFLLAIDKAKMDALSQSRRGSASKLWKVLERMSLKSKIRRGLSLRNDAAMITTLVISKEEAELLKKYHNIYIDRAEVATPIMNSYNLMAFIIADESLEAADFLFDTGDDIFEQIPFVSLERDNGNGDVYKKVMNLMTRMR